MTQITNVNGAGNIQPEDPNKKAKVKDGQEEVETFLPIGGERRDDYGDGFTPSSSRDETSTPPQERQGGEIQTPPKVEQPVVSHERPEGAVTLSADNKQTQQPPQENKAGETQQEERQYIRKTADGHYETATINENGERVWSRENIPNEERTYFKRDANGKFITPKPSEETSADLPHQESYKLADLNAKGLKTNETDLQTNMTADMQALENQRLDLANRIDRAMQDGNQELVQQLNNELYQVNQNLNSATNQLVSDNGGDNAIRLGDSKAVIDAKVQAQQGTNPQGTGGVNQRGTTPPQGDSANPPAVNGDNPRVNTNANSQGSGGANQRITTPPQDNAENQPLKPLEQGQYLAKLTDSVIENGGKINVGGVEIELQSKADRLADYKKQGVSDAELEKADEAFITLVKQNLQAVDEGKAEVKLNEQGKPTFVEKAKTVESGQQADPTKTGDVNKTADPNKTGETQPKTLVAAASAENPASKAETEAEKLMNELVNLKNTDKKAYKNRIMDTGESLQQEFAANKKYRSLLDNPSRIRHIDLEREGIKNTIKNLEKPDQKDTTEYNEWEVKKDTLEAYEEKLRALKETMTGVKRGFWYGVGLVLNPVLDIGRAVTSSGTSQTFYTISAVGDTARSLQAWLR